MASKSIARNDDQLTLIYSSATRVGQRTRAQIAGIEDKKLQAIDIVNTKLTGTQWAEIAIGLGVQMKDLISYDEVDEEEEKYAGGDYDENSLINILNNNPKLFVHPVVILGEKMKKITNPTQIQEFIEVDSAGLEKKMMYEEPVISRQTKGEKFIEKPEGEENP